MLKILKGKFPMRIFPYEASLLCQNISAALRIKREVLTLFPCEAVATGALKRLDKDRIKDMIMS
jgi:hypothetical protein